MISVIVPVFNSSIYLSKCINSLLKQTYKDLEIILIDDASTDNSWEICNKYAKSDSRIKIYQQSRNQGQVAAYLRGLSEATGDLIGFVDSDDWVEPEFYSELYEQMKKAGSDISCCGAYQEYVDHSEVEPHNIADLGIRNYQHNEIIQYFKELHIPNNEISEIIKLYRWNKLFKKKIIYDNLKYVQIDVRAFEDNNLVIPCLIDANSISYVNKPLYHYIRHQNSTTSFFDRSIIDSNKKFLSNQEFIYKDKGIPHDMASDAYVTSSYSLFKSATSDYSIKDKKALLSSVRDEAALYHLNSKVVSSFGANRRIILMYNLLINKRYIAIIILGNIYNKINQITRKIK